MGIASSENCSFCDKEKDSVQHYLWFCNFSQDFWRDIEKLFREKCDNCFRMKLNVELVLFGNDEHTTTDEVFDQIILFAKHFVYKCRIHKIKPNIKHFLKELKQMYDIEKYSQYKKMMYMEFHKKWYPYQNLLNEKKKKGKCLKNITQNFFKL